MKTHTLYQLLMRGLVAANHPYPHALACGVLSEYLADVAQRDQAQAQYAEGAAYYREVERAAETRRSAQRWRAAGETADALPPDEFC